MTLMTATQPRPLETRGSHTSGVEQQLHHSAQISEAIPNGPFEAGNAMCAEAA